MPIFMFDKDGNFQVLMLEQVSMPALVHVVLANLMVCAAPTDVVRTWKSSSAFMSICLGRSSIKLGCVYKWCNEAFGRSYWEWYPIEETLEDLELRISIINGSGVSQWQRSLIYSARSSFRSPMKVLPRQSNEAGYVQTTEYKDTWLYLDENFTLVLWQKVAIGSNHIFLLLDNCQERRGIKSSGTNTLVPW
jgi:hypothetical protein